VWHAHQAGKRTEAEAETGDAFRADSRRHGESRRRAARIDETKEPAERAPRNCRSVKEDPMSSPARVSAVDSVSILFVDPEMADDYLPVLRRHYEVTAVSSEEQAIRALRAFQPTLVITELALPEGDGVSLCRQSKAFDANPPWVLATTSVPERVPDALKAGCDGVLMKPFPPNLLFGRIGRLLRIRAKALQDRAMWQRARSTYLLEHSHKIIAGTNIVCHDAACPSCGERGVVSFDAASYRRMWYACLPCSKVWMAPRRSD
jgi:CheY-like chemotaxis protein